MILSNYSNLIKWYSIQSTPENLTYGALCFGYIMDSPNAIDTYNTEDDLILYVNNFYKDDNWYQSHKEIVHNDCPYTESFLDNLVTFGWSTQYDWRLSMNDETSNLLNAKLLALSGNSDNNTYINIQDSAGNLHSLSVQNFVSLVFNYQQARPVFMNVVKQIRDSFNK
jgi:hypothetical protein